MPPIESATRTRKSSAEVRASLLEAGRQIFSERGFSGATTREIAARASTSESLLFRHFGNKAGLFTAAVVSPFSEFIDSWVDKWSDKDAQYPVQEPIEDFFSALYSMLREQRTVAIALLAAHEHEHDLRPAVNLAPLLDRLETVTAHEARLRGWNGLDVFITNRVGFGLLCAGALFKDWFFADPTQVPDQRILDEMIALLIDGLSHRAAAPASAVDMVHDPERCRLSVRVSSEADQAAALRAASGWLAAHDVRIDDLSWRRTELRLYYSPVPSSRS